MKEYLIVILIAISSTFTAGYQFAVSDQQIFIPFILKLQNPSLFKDDLLFSQLSANASLFYQFFAYLINYVDIQTVFFIGFLITKSVFFIGIFLLSKLIFRKSEIALLSLLPFLIPKFIGGTATYTFDNYLGYRSVGTIFLVFYILFALKKQFIKSAIVAGLSLFFHPLSVIPNLLIGPVLIARNSRAKTKDFTLFVIIITLSMFMYLWTFQLQPEILKRSAEWLSIIKSRDDYIFISLWTILGWLSLFLYITLNAIYLKNRKNLFRIEIILILIVSLLILFANYIFLDFLQFSQFAKFQLARSITPIALIGLIVSPGLILNRFKYLRFFGYISFALLSLNLFYLFLISFGIFAAIYLKNKNSHINSSNVSTIKIIIPVILFAAILNFFYLKNPINFPLEQNDWVKSQIWANKNTALDAKYLVPPWNTGFRIFSQRAIVGDIKDGAVVIYSPDYAQEWHKIINDTKNYENLTENNFIKLKEKYAFDYILTDSKKSLNFPKVFQNNSYTLYKI